MLDRGLRDDAVFIAIAFAAAWLLLLLPTGSAGQTAASFAPTIAALVVAARQGGRPHVVKQLKRFVQFRAPPSTYVLGFFLFPAVLVGAFSLLGFGPDKGDWTDVIITIVVAAPLNYGLGVLVFATAGPQGEELGWRGYLLPRWIERWGIARAGTLVGIVWTLWHLPLFLDPGWRSPGVPLALALLLYAISVISMSFALGFIALLSRQNLLVCIFMHGAINLSFNMLTAFSVAFRENGLLRYIAMDVAAVGTAAILGVLYLRRRRLPAAVPTAT